MRKTGSTPWGKHSRAILARESKSKGFRYVSFFWLLSWKFLTQSWRKNLCSRANNCVSAISFSTIRGKLFLNGLRSGPYYMDQTTQGKN